MIQTRILFSCQIRPCSSGTGATPTRPPMKIHRANVSRKPTPSATNGNGGSLFVPNFSISEQVVRKFPEQINRLSKTLEDRALEQADECSKLQKQVDTIFAALQGRLESETRRLAIIGSASNSLLRKGSDIDIHNLEFQKMPTFRKISYLNSMSKQIVSLKLVHSNSVNVLQQARVPIIQFRTTNKFKVDIQVCCPESIVSSHFIGCSVRYDVRVRALILWLLKNFSVSSLKDSRHGLFSSYHICSLVIHFLRSIPDPIIPDFHSFLQQKDPYANWVSVLSPRSLDLCPDDAVCDSLSSGHLLVKMIDYYAQINLHKIGLNTTGGYVKKKFEPHDEGSDLYMWDPCFQSNSEGQCHVFSAPTLISQHFTGLRMAMKVGNFAQII